MNRDCSSPVRLWVSKAVRERILRVERSWNGPHRDWASEKTGHPQEVIGPALAHVVRN